MGSASSTLFISLTTFSLGMQAFLISVYYLHEISSYVSSPPLSYTEPLRGINVKEPIEENRTEKRSHYSTFIFSP